MSYFCALTHPFFFILWCGKNEYNVFLTIMGVFILIGLGFQLIAGVLSRYLKQEAISNFIITGCILQLAGGVTQLILGIILYFINRPNVGFYFFAVMLQHINSIPFYYTFRGYFKQAIKNVVVARTKEIQNWYNQNKL